LFRVRSLGITVKGIGFRVYGLGWGLEFGVYMGFRVQGSGFRV